VPVAGIEKYVTAFVQGSVKEYVSTWLYAFTLQQTINSKTKYVFNCFNHVYCSLKIPFLCIRSNILPAAISNAFLVDVPIVD